MDGKRVTGLLSFLDFLTFFSKCAGSEKNAWFLGQEAMELLHNQYLPQGKEWVNLVPLWQAEYPFCSQS